MVGSGASSGYCLPVDYIKHVTLFINGSLREDAIQGIIWSEGEIQPAAEIVRAAGDVVVRLCLDAVHGCDVPFVVFACGDRGVRNGWHAVVADDQPDHRDGELHGNDHGEPSGRGAGRQDRLRQLAGPVSGVVLRRHHGVSRAWDGLVFQSRRPCGGTAGSGGGISEDPVVRRRVELRAMLAVGLLQRTGGQHAADDRAADRADRERRHGLRDDFRQMGLPGDGRRRRGMGDRPFESVPAVDDALVVLRP